MLSLQEYLKLASDLKRLCTLHVANDVDRRSFNSGPAFFSAVEFASANLRHLLPEIPLTEHERILTEALFSKASAELDEASGFLLEHAVVHDPGGWLSIARERPVIFCSFHYGSYRLIHWLLARAGLKFLVLLTQALWDAKYATFMEIQSEALSYSAATSGRMEILNAEVPTAALTLARKVRAGWVVLANLDGDDGVRGAGRHDDKMLRTTLLEQPLFTRKGVAFLSHFLYAPVVPIVCKRTGLIEREITIHDPVYPLRKSEDRDTYCQAVTNKLYVLLGEYLESDPGQWERWFDIQTALDTDAIAANHTEVPQSPSGAASPGYSVEQLELIFNCERFGFVTHAGDRALLDKDTYRLLSLPAAIMAVVESYREIRRPSFGGGGVDDPDTVQQLVEDGILHAPALEAYASAVRLNASAAAKGC